MNPCSQHPTVRQGCCSGDEHLVLDQAMVLVRWVGACVQVEQLSTRLGAPKVREKEIEKEAWFTRVNRL